MRPPDDKSLSLLNNEFLSRMIVGTLVLLSNYIEHPIHPHIVEHQDNKITTIKHHFILKFIGINSHPDNFPDYLIKFQQSKLGWES